MLVAWVIVVAAVTLYPFEFAGAGSPWRIEMLFAGRHGQDLPDALLNLGLFVPFGWWLGRLSAGVGGQAVGAASAAVAGAAVSLTIECLQVLVPDRNPSLVDVAANAAGAACGAFARRSRFGSRCDAAWLGWTVSPSGLVLLLGAATAFALLGSAFLQQRTRLSNWSDFPLALGNEPSGDRPWRGRIHAVQITDAAMPLADMSRFARGETPRLPGTTVADFDFSTGGPYTDAASTVPDLRWTPFPHPPKAGPITLAGTAWLVSREPAVGFADRLRSSHAFTVRLIAASDDAAQEGPARLVTHSSDSTRRNLMLGQQGPDLVVRLRTPATGINGTRPELLVPNVFAQPLVRDLLVTYDGARLAATWRGSEDVVRAVFGPGAAVMLLLPIANVGTGHLRPADLLYVAGLFCIAGSLIARVRARPAAQAAAAAAWIAVFAAVHEWTIAGVAGRSPDVTEVSLGIVVGAATLAAAAFTSAYARASGTAGAPDRSPVRVV